MNFLSNKARVKEVTQAYIQNTVNITGRTAKNLEFLEKIVEKFIEVSGIELAEQYIDIDKASGKWLDDIGKLAMVSRNDFQGSTVFDDDNFFRTYIRFGILKNFVRASISTLAEMTFLLFGLEVQIVRQQRAFVLGLFVSSQYFEIVKFLIDNKLFPLPLCHNIFIMGQQAPEGYLWWSYFALPYSLVLEGAMTQEQYEILLTSQENWFYTPKDGDIKLVWIPKEFIYIPNGN